MKSPYILESWKKSLPLPSFIALRRPITGIIDAAPPLTIIKDAMEIGIYAYLLPVSRLGYFDHGQLLSPDVKKCAKPAVKRTQFSRE